MQVGRVIDRVRALLDGLSPADRRLVFTAIRETHFSPMTSTERTRRQRLTGEPPDETAASQTMGRQRPTKWDDSVPTDETAPSQIPSNSPNISSSSLSFEQFWSNYPNKVGKGKAEESWKKRNCSKILVKILDAVEKQRAFLDREGGKFCPNPATWLNQKRWNDEPRQPNFLSEKTRGNVDVAKAFIEGKSKE